MILIYLTTALVLGPVAYYSLPRSSRRRRISLVAGIIALAWLAETAFIVWVGDEPPKEAVLLVLSNCAGNG